MPTANFLTVKIYSFSYKKEIPKDNTGNGGGYVFDCRGVLNPGRIEEYKTQTGRDLAVITYLETQTEMPSFIECVKKILDISLKNYIERGFSNLQVSFGCTGGQHRSVYSADTITKHIKKNYPSVVVDLQHVEQEAKNWINEVY